MASDKALDLTVQIAGKIDKSLLAAIDKTQSKISDLVKNVSRMGAAGLNAMSRFATESVTALAECTHAAQEFEGQMADVVKYVGDLADSSGKVSDKIAENGKSYAQNYADMRDAILDLSTQIPITAEELTQLAAAAGQSGKSISDLIQRDSDGNIGGFLKDIAMMGTAMDISAEQAGDWAVEWEQAFHMDHDEIMVLADQISYLGANSAVTAAEIAQAVNSAANLGQIGEIHVSTTAALADAMLATGISSDRVGSSIKHMVTNFSKGIEATQAQKELWMELGFTAEGVASSMQADSVGTLESIFNAIKGMPEHRQVVALSTLFGQWAIEGGAKIVNNLDVYEKALDMVRDANGYSASIEREFIIKASTSDAVDTMMASTFQAAKIDIGAAFLPAKKSMSVALIDFMNQLRNMPELGEIAQTLAALFSQGVSWAGEALEKALPYIQQALNYLLDHGPQVVNVLKNLAIAFAAMKFAPGITGVLGGAGDLLLGKASGGGNHTARTGGLTGMLSSLWKGGGNAAGAASPGLLSNYQRVGGVIKDSIAGSGIGQYFSGVLSSLGSLGDTKIGGRIAGGVKAAGGALGEIVSGISQSTGLTGLVNRGLGAARSGAGWVASRAGGLVQGAMGVAGHVASLAPVQAVGGALGNIGSFVGAGTGVLGSILGPMKSGFGGLLTGALPIVGVISSVIAVVSLLGDHLEDIRGIVGNVFGDAGLAVFDSFIGPLQHVGDFISGLFQDGSVAEKMAPLRDAVTGIFGDDAGAAFDGLVQILQSVMGVVGQVVTFANTTVKPIVQEIFGFLTQTVVPIILQTFTAAAPVISGIINNLGTAVMTVAGIIGTAIQAVLPVVENIIAVIMSIASVVVPALLGAFEGLTSMITPIIETIKGILGGLFQAVGGVVDFITGVFTGNWEKAWQGVKNIFGGIWKALVGLVKLPINGIIGIINGAIGGLNNLSFTMPEWSPIMPGEKIGFDIPEIPYLAKGGFTNGPSIAGEAGTEAVISFQRSERARNISTWLQAGKMLGMGNQPAGLLDLPAGGGDGFSISFAPHIEIKGNADRGMVDKALMESEQRFEAWMEANFARLYERMERERGRRVYA